MPRFSCLLKRANPSFSFYDIFATNFLNPIDLLYTRPPIHPTTKKLSAMACPLLLHLLSLPHPSSSTCGLGSSCQPGLCALSGSEVQGSLKVLISVYPYLEKTPNFSRFYPARALRALGLLLADGAPTVGGGKTF